MYIHLFVLLLTQLWSLVKGNNNNNHVVPLARISLTLSRHFFLSFIASGRSSGLHPVSSHLTLNVAICIVCLHFSSFCLSSVADFSNSEVRAPTSAGRGPFLPARRAMQFMYVV